MNVHLGGANPDGPRLTVETTTWSTFVNAVKGDDFHA